jgi:hypothetical protein
MKPFELFILLIFLTLLFTEAKPTDRFSFNRIKNSVVLTNSAEAFQNDLLLHNNFSFFAFCSRTIQLSSF